MLNHRYVVYLTVCRIYYLWLKHRCLTLRAPQARWCHLQLRIATSNKILKVLELGNRSIGPTTKPIISLGNASLIVVPLQTKGCWWKLWPSVRNDKLTFLIFTHVTAMDHGLNSWCQLGITYVAQNGFAMLSFLYSNYWKPTGTKFIEKMSYLVLVVNFQQAKFSLKTKNQCSRQIWITKLSHFVVNINECKNI